MLTVLKILLRKVALHRAEPHFPYLLFKSVCLEPASELSRARPHLVLSQYRPRVKMSADFLGLRFSSTSLTPCVKDLISAYSEIGSSGSITPGKEDQ